MKRIESPFDAEWVCGQEHCPGLPSPKRQRMDEPFDLPVMYRNQEILFPAKLQQTGYSHRFCVEVNGHEVFFEPDEERNYRAIINPEEVTKEISVELLQAIAATIESLVK